MGFRFTKIDSTYEERIRINARRVRAGWGVWLAQFPWEHMLTLTTDPARFARASEQGLNREVFRFCCELSYLSRRPVAWAYAVEGGGGVALHAHVLTTNTTNAARTAALLGWQARSGRTHRRDVTDTRAATDYLCKCIGPDGEVVLSDALFRYRRNPVPNSAAPESQRR